MYNVIIDEEGYWTGMACEIGKFENGIDVERLPNETDIIKQRAYRLENYTWNFDKDRYQELLQQENQKYIIDEAEKELQILLNWFEEYDNQVRQYQRCQRLGIEFDKDINKLDNQAKENSARITELRKLLNINK